jgi:hypothetical protein
MLNNARALKDQFLPRKTVFGKSIHVAYKKQGDSGSYSLNCKRGPYAIDRNPLLYKFTLQQLKSLKHLKALVRSVYSAMFGYANFDFLIYEVNIRSKESLQGGRQKPIQCGCIRFLLNRGWVFSAPCFWLRSKSSSTRSYCARNWYCTGNRLQFSVSPVVFQYLKMQLEARISNYGFSEQCIVCLRSDISE